MSRKGDSTKTRPHRRSDAGISYRTKLCRYRRNNSCNWPRLRNRLPRNAEKKPAPAGQAIDLGRWLRDHAIGIADEKPYQGGILFTLDECPFSGAHKDGAFAIQFPSGAIYAGCHHSSCGGGEQRWQELREKFEPKRKRKKTVASTSHPHHRGPGSSTPFTGIKPRQFRIMLRQWPSSNTGTR